MSIFTTHLSLFFMNYADAVWSPKMSEASDSSERSSDTIYKNANPSKEITRTWWGPPDRVVLGFTVVVAIINTESTSVVTGIASLGVVQPHDNELQASERFLRERGHDIEQIEAG